MKGSNMKKLLFIGSILFLLVGSSFSQNQRIAPIGAIWYYETQGLFFSGYIKMEAEKDTVVNGQACVKLARETHWHNLELDELHDSVLPPLFISQDGDAAMVYYGGGFSVLFDFGAEVNDSWTVPGREGMCEEDFGTVRVVGKGTETYHGVELRYLLLVDEPGSHWGFSPTLYGEPSDTIKVVERIGPIGSHFLPEQKCLFDDAEGGPLRCYLDDELYELHLSTLHPERNCDYISETYHGIEEQDIKDIVSISPVPCGNMLHVVFDPQVQCNYKVTVFDMLGTMVFNSTISGKDTEINMDNLPSGLYCLVVDGGYKSYSKTFVKK